MQDLTPHVPVSSPTCRGGAGRGAPARASTMNGEGHHEERVASGRVKRCRSARGQSSRDCRRDFRHAPEHEGQYEGCRLRSRTSS